MTTKEEVLEKDLNALDWKHILKNKCSIIIMSYNLHDSFSFVCGRSNFITNFIHIILWCHTLVLILIQLSSEFRETTNIYLKMFVGLKKNPDIGERIY